MPGTRLYFQLRLKPHPGHISYISPPSSTNSKRLWTRVEVNRGAIRGLYRRPRGPSRLCFGGVRGSMHRHTKGKEYSFPPPLPARYSRWVVGGWSHTVGQRSGNFVKGTCTQATIRLRRDVVASLRRLAPHLNISRFPYFVLENKSVMRYIWYKDYYSCPSTRVWIRQMSLVGRRSCARG